MENKENNSSFTGIGMLIRLYWMVFGNFINILLAIYIAVKNTKLIMLLSIFYFLNTLCLIILRYVDIRYLNGLTTEYEPATMKHWKEYSVKLIIFYLVLWIIVYFLKDNTFIKLGS